MQIRKIVPWGCECPKYHGIAWNLYHQAAGVYYPWPFNILIGFFRKIWVDCRYFWIESEHEKLVGEVVINTKDLKKSYEDLVVYSDQLRKENEDLRRLLIVNER